MEACPSSLPPGKFGILGLQRLFLMQFLGKNQALDDMLQNTAIVLSIESLCSRHSQLGESVALQ